MSVLPTPPALDLGPVEVALGRRITSFTPGAGGFTLARTGIATLDDSTRVFVKAAPEGPARDQITREIRNLRMLGAIAPPVPAFLPRMVAAVADPPVLVIEDLSAAHWPEPYPEDLTGLEEALAALHALPVPTGLDLERFGPPGDDVLGSLVDNARLALGPAAEWVEDHAGRIRSAVAAIAPGEAMIHTDLWYANLCFLPGRVVIVDWSHLALGAPAFDRSTVSIDLVIEGRPPLAVPDAAGWAAAHLAWATSAMARGAGPAIAHPGAWLADNRELFDGAAWWFAHELGLERPPRLTTRDVGW